MESVVGMNHVSLVTGRIIITFHTNDIDSRNSRREYAWGKSPPKFCNLDSERHVASRYPPLLNFLNVKLGNWPQPVPLHRGSIEIQTSICWLTQPFVSPTRHHEVSKSAVCAWNSDQSFRFCRKAASEQCTYNNQLQSRYNCPPRPQFHFSQILEPIFHAHTLS